MNLEIIQLTATHMHRIPGDVSGKRIRFLDMLVPRTAPQKERILHTFRKCRDMERDDSLGDFQAIATRPSSHQIEAVEGIECDVYAFAGNPVLDVSAGVNLLLANPDPDTNTMFITYTLE